MKYGSLCSGIEAATQAWHPMGWEPAFFSEIDAFPSAALAHHYPDVPNYGDMTKFKEWPDANINVLVGGTPCQSFSVAGLRKGLDDPRGNLMLTFGAIAARYRPTWLVWENVPGVLSSNGGRDFGTFLGMLGQLGYGFAYRVLDAQYFGLAQRRKRVFVVAHSGGWRGAAAVLFERHSLSGHPAPRRETGEGVAGFTAGSFGGYREGVGTIRAEGGDIGPGSETIDVCMAHGQGGAEIGFDRGPTLTCNHGAPLIAHTLRAEYDASEDGTGRGTPIVPVAIPINTQIATRGEKLGKGTGFGIGDDGDPGFTLQAAHSHAVAFGWQNSPSQGDSVSEHVTPTLDKSKTPAVAVSLRGRDGGATAELGDEVQNCLRASSGGGDKPHVLNQMAVRRLTPVECERLQGFPDNFTRIPYRNKSADKCPDGPRYKALGNSMAVPCMAWIGQRIQAVDDIYAEACEVVAGMNVGELHA